MRLLLSGLLLLLAGHTDAQDLTVYDNALQNGFVGNYSYGGGTQLQHPTTTHNGSAFSIGFTGNNSNAVAFPHETVDFNSSQYAGIRFYVHGGVAGGQQLRLHIYNNLGGAPVANVELDSFIAGGAIAANEWRLVEARFNNAPLAFAGTFDRFDLQSDDPDTQPVLYIDDIQLIAAAPLSSNIFASGFEDGAAPSPGQVRLSSVTFSGAENGGPITITAERVGGSSGPASVTYASSTGTAIAPGDYTAASGSLAWANGEAGTKELCVDSRRRWRCGGRRNAQCDPQRSRRRQPRRSRERRGDDHRA